MTATCTPSTNGRKESRRSLSEEIDRFDQMLDGLAEAIPATIAEAVKDATSTAVAEAVRATLLEIAAHPELLAMLRPPGAAAVKPASEVKNAPPSRIGSVIALAWKRAIGKLKAAGHAVLAPVRGVAGAAREINKLWNLRRPVIIALGVGIAVGTAGALSAPWLAGVLSGVGAAGTMLFGQFAAWTRRVFVGFSMG